MKRRIAILGSTGSIGTQALDICALHPESYRVVALTAKSSREKLFEQVRRFRPEMAGLLDGIRIEDVPEDIVKKLSIVFVKTADEVLSRALLHGTPQKDPADSGYKHLPVVTAPVSPRA